MMPPLKLAASLLVVALLNSAHAQTSVVTVPVGFVDVDIAGSANGTAHAVTPFSAPLLNNPTITGQSLGKITGVTSTSLSNTAGGWVTDELAAVGSPNYIKINTGSAAGRMFLITANTNNSLTVDSQGLDLTTLGIAAGSSGDNYEIVQGETLLTLLGTAVDGIIGGTSTQFNAGQTDKVIVNDVSGVSRTYYYDASGKWMRPGSPSNQGTLAISPQAGLVYYRISTTPIAFTFTGKVPTTDSLRQVPSSGTTIMASFFPVDSNIGTLNLNAVQNWRKLGDAGVILNTTDRVIVKDVAGVIRSYYYDATSGVNFWKRAGSPSNQNIVPVNAGSAVYCTRFGASGSSQTWTYNIPYSL